MKMKVLPQSHAGYFSSVILVLVLSQVAICVEDSINTNAKQKLQPISVTTSSSTDPPDRPITGNNETKHEIESITKHPPSTDGPIIDQPEKNATKANLSHDNIPINTGPSNHSTDISVLPKPQPSLNSTTAPTVTNSTSIANNESLPSTESHLPSVPPTVHRKSKPEETTVDDVIRDSGPTTDYVVPLVIAMLAVPLVGVLCALLYMKGRDFWERRHYGRIDFLWDSRNDSRMDFLIDGMYNN